MVDLLAAGNYAGCVHLLRADLLLLDHLRWYLNASDRCIKLLSYLAGLILIYLLLELFEHFVFLCLVFLVVCDLFHDIVGLSHLHLDFLLVEHDVLHPLIDVPRFFHEVISLAHYVCHIYVDRGHFQLVLLLNHHCSPCTDQLLYQNFVPTLHWSGSLRFRPPLSLHFSYPGL